MSSRRTKLVRTIVAAMGLAGLSMIVQATPSSATPTPSLVIWATSAQVNRSGQITVSGGVACAAAVRAVFGNAPPANLTVFVNIGWHATQGRASGTFVEGRSDRATPCYNTWPGVGGPLQRQLQNCGSAWHPCPWRTTLLTSYPACYTGGCAQDPYQGSGFRPTIVRVDLTAATEGAFVCVNGPAGTPGCDWTHPWDIGASGRSYLIASGVRGRTTVW